MSLHQKIKDQIKEALKNREETRLSVLRGILTAFTNEAATPQDELTDDEALKVIKKEANKRKDSIDQYTKGGRNELAEQEQKELEILEAYLPEMMGVDEIRKIAEAKKTELGIEDKSKMGILIGAVMKETKGLADGKDVKDVVDSLL